jgi:hypothetical protein
VLGAGTTHPTADLASSSDVAIHESFELGRVRVVQVDLVRAAFPRKLDRLVRRRPIEVILEPFCLTCIDPGFIAEAMFSVSRRARDTYDMSADNACCIERRRDARGATHEVGC